MACATHVAVAPLCARGPADIMLSVFCSVWNLDRLALQLSHNTLHQTLRVQGCPLLGWGLVLGVAAARACFLNSIGQEALLLVESGRLVKH